MNAPRPRSVIGWLLLASAIGALVWAGVWRLYGGQWERVESPSMGTAAPVGTLLWVEPTKFDQLQVGDFITFRAPTSHAVYSHRVYAIDADGTLRTKGDIVGTPDPWRLHSSDVIGKVAMRWWGVGWLVRAAPVLLIGALTLWALVSRFMSSRWKAPAAIVGVALIISIAIVVYRPLVNAEQLSFTPAAQGARAKYVGTGLLPIRMSAHYGGHVDLRNGQVGALLSTHPDGHGKYPVSFAPHIPLLWWIALVMICFVPALWSLVFGLRGQRPAYATAGNAANSTA